MLQKHMLWYLMIPKALTNVNKLILNAVLLLKLYFIIIILIMLHSFSTTISKTSKKKKSLTILGKTRTSVCS